MNEDASIMVKDSTFKMERMVRAKVAQGVYCKTLRLIGVAAGGGQWVQVHPQGQNLNFWGLIYRGKL